MLDNLRSTIRGWQHEDEPSNFGGYALGEEVIEVSESLLWREGELYPDTVGTIGSREVEG
jgi:hypothetical protein